MDRLVAVGVGSTAGEQDAAGERLGQTVGTRDHQLHLLEVAQPLHVLVLAYHLHTQGEGFRKRVYFIVFEEENIKSNSLKYDQLEIC